LALRDASLAIEEGEIFVIMGLSGSGKSTMVRLLNRLIEPTRGQVLIDGVDIARISDAELREVRRKKIAMVFQSFALMPHMTVLDNAAFGMELAGVGASGTPVRKRWTRCVRWAWRTMLTDTRMNSPAGCATRVVSPVR
jgi:glycine betaine/proline transport system ATP-binding protein